jgi:hypothetical protein
VLEGQHVGHLLVDVHAGDRFAGRVDLGRDDRLDVLVADGDGRLDPELDDHLAVAGVDAERLVAQLGDRVCVAVVQVGPTGDPRGGDLARLGEQQRDVGRRDRTRRAVDTQHRGALDAGRVPARRLAVVQRRGQRRGDGVELRAVPGDDHGQGAELPPCGAVDGDRVAAGRRHDPGLVGAGDGVRVCRPLDLERIGTAPRHQSHATDDDVHGAELPGPHCRAYLVGQLHDEDVALVGEVVGREPGLVRAADRLVELGDRGGGLVHVRHENVQVLPRLGPLRLQGRVAELDATDERLHALDELGPSGVRVRLVGDVLPAVPHIGQQALDPGVPRLAERGLDLLEGIGLDGQAGTVGVLGVATALQEGVADALDVVGGDTGADARAGGVERRDRAAADGLQVDPLTGVALGVDVGDVLPGDVQRAALRPQRGRHRVEPGERTHRMPSSVTARCDPPSVLRPVAP